MSIYDEIGAERVASIVHAFYAKAFVDPMLAHFFMSLDHQLLVDSQIAFTSSLLGGPQAYRGKPLTHAHDRLLIRPPHFRRRQRILRETMIEQGLSEHLMDAWLNQEDKLKPLIMKDQSSCSQ